MLTRREVTKWFTEHLTLVFLNANHYVRYWDIMPSTGILFAIYACCLDICKASELAGVNTAASQG